MTALLIELETVSTFPGAPPPGYDAEKMALVLRDATASIRRFIPLVQTGWLHLESEDREFLRKFVMRPKQMPLTDEATHLFIMELLTLHEEAVAMFFQARQELRDVVLPLVSREVWADATSSDTFVDASNRGFADLIAGRLKRVRKDEL